MTGTALGIGADGDSLAQHLAPFEARITGSLEGALAELAKRPVDLVLVDTDRIGADPGATLALLVSPGRALVAVSETMPDPTTLLAFCAAWLPQNVSPDRTRPVLVSAARRAREQREDAKAAATLDAQLKTHRDWAKSAKRALDELMHELKTPIGIVQGYASNLLDQIDGPISDSQRNSVERIRAAAKLMTGVVRSAAPRLEPPALEQGSGPARRMRAKREQLDLTVLVREALALFSRAADARRIALGADASPDLPLVWGDRSRLVQVLVNLLSNAMRFVPDGGAIRAELRRDGDSCDIAISDSGPGIEEALADRLFEAGVSGQGRTGLGLAIAREIASEHRGTISVEANGPLGGATFHLRVPIDARARRGRLEILLIDDAVLAGQLLIELRNRHGSHVPASRPNDMEELAARILEQSSTVVFAGEVEQRLSTQTIDLPRDLDLESDG